MVRHRMTSLRSVPRLRRLHSRMVRHTVVVLKGCRPKLRREHLIISGTRLLTKYEYDTVAALLRSLGPFCVFADNLQAHSRQGP